jgi:hypothetical protein
VLYPRVRNKILHSGRYRKQFRVCLQSYWNGNTNHYDIDHYNYYIDNIPANYYDLDTDNQHGRLNHNYNAKYYYRTNRA